MTETAGELGSGSAAIPAVIADRYRLERELGRGGAAIVWLAHDMVQERDVAVKVLRAEIAHTVASNRFLEEIRIDTELSHPHLLPVLGSGEFEGLLYYVTPYIAGGSLRARMDRERQMPVDIALTIVSDVAGALEYSHRHGVIHRDVKPENILIDGDHAFVADFGIARALTRALDERITSTGISVGTPAYMSPEQAAGNRDLDERTDIYSLGCVLYEMLAGVAPFVGPSPESVIAQRFVHSPHPLRVYRATVPAEVERAVARAMTLAPADRFRTMGEFATALNARDMVAAPSTVPQRRWGRRESVITGGVAAALVAAVATSRVVWPVSDSVGAGADTTRYLVASVSTDGVGVSPVVARQRLTDAFRRWRDITIVEPTQPAVSSVLPRSADGVAALASRAQVGRVVMARLAALGDSIELSATLHDARGSVVREDAVRARVGDSTSLRQLYGKVSAALLADSGSDAEVASATGSDRVAAWRSYSRGRAAIARWDLTGATRELRQALVSDPQYAQAQLWLAQSLAWARPDHAEEWQRDALRAASLSSALGAEDSLFAAGVVQLATGAFPKACDTYRRALGVTRRAEFAWLGLAQCQAMDPVVLRDGRSPSGWRFRGSYHSAALAYDSALARAPGAPGFAFMQYLRLLPAESYRTRDGWLASSDTVRFVAHPSLDADTLAFIPFAVARVSASDPNTLPPTLAKALNANADRLASLFRDWVRRAPASMDALGALAYAQEVRGEYEDRQGGGLAALDTYRSAVRVSTDSTRRIRLTAAIVRVLVKGEQYLEAHRLADSLLRSNPSPSVEQATSLAGVAALIGAVSRAETLLALAYSAPGALRSAPLPHAITDAVARLTANAALGVCDPRLGALVRDAEQLVDRYVAPEGRAAVRAEVLARPLSLAVPCLGPAIVEQTPGARGSLVQMQRALGRGDFAAVRAHFDTLARMRRVYRVGDITLDVTYQEASLLLAMHDTTGAQRKLCAPLSALPTLSTRILTDAPQAAAVGRSLVLCAQLAVRRGDAPAARHFAQAATALWSTADKSLEPLLKELPPLVAASD